MEMQAGLGQQALPERHRADEIQHGAVAASACGAERQAEDGTQMILELAGFRALEGPVTGVVHTRCHLVRNEPAAADEELDGQNAAISEMVQRAAQVTRGLALKRR